ncbi:MAG: hypothetical protein AUH72_15920 [Acidobacteria bacterium 13_1_40CM_4_65_8]|nr:MAG: hypothetical protein AUH72_15920 [Acidobacteria bacterium 13_1_40CM_4_65_8]
MVPVSRGLHVVATTDEGIRRALSEAARLVNGSDGRLLLLIPHVVPRFETFSAASDAAAITDRYRALASSMGLEVVVRVCLCRRRHDVFRLMLGRRAHVVIGGRRRWWWPTAAERLAARLKRHGHEVVFANV